MAGDKNVFKGAVFRRFFASGFSPYNVYCPPPQKKSFGMISILVKLFVFVIDSPVHSPTESQRIILQIRPFVIH
jgi:hypothetical protein